MQVNELARATDTTPQIIRFYARIGLITPTKRGASSETCRLSRMIVAPMGSLALQDLDHALLFLT